MGESNLMYILADFTSKMIWNKVLNPIINDWGLDIKFDSHGNFELFDVTIVQAYLRFNRPGRTSIPGTLLSLRITLSIFYCNE
ncbi:hypothetical protein LSI01_04380 [Furfurilactobacillus siliginis]|uniref:Uncharacterized protein n=1 Tax=Furfurilactobacillus siliginis TaxID=348151 RepID=A0A510VMK3_9LACO|nr:hypothetical protein LSI01_04380 [Furfurilactobacillus siliginis]